MFTTNRTKNMEKRTNKIEKLVFFTKRANKVEKRTKNVEKRTKQVEKRTGKIEKRFFYKTYEKSRNVRNKVGETFFVTKRAKTIRS